MATVGTPFRDILQAIKDRLTDKTNNGLIWSPDDTGTVYVSNRQNPPALDGKKSLVIVPLYQQYLQPATEGHGRCGVIKKARIDVYYRHDSSLDQTYADDTFLLADDGYFQILERVEDALDLWFPVNSISTVPLLVHPMRATMDNEPRKKYEDHTKGDGMVELECEFIAYRTAGYTPP